MIELTEQAYEMLGSILIRKAQPDWLSLHAHCPILGKGCGGITTTQKHANGVADIPIGMDVFVVQEVCLFLREFMLKTTGHRIWGLNFTLYPDGKFDTEFDYNKPEDYEETDETIDVSLTDFVDQLNKK
jgi:hypothetical protein